ncbi:MAG: hypothetical protein KAS23_06610 [Anaerohalosphaera sp.]|nr:hypothetical protein [Anaerohalosphaera sp.]
MKDKVIDFESELEDIKMELDNFQQEKERVRAIIGKIGGVPTFHTKIVNTTFILLIVGSLIVSMFGKGGEFRMIMIEFATLALSIKIIYMMHCQSRVNHFQVWMQSSIEWRINEIMKMIMKIDNKV